MHGTRRRHLAVTTLLWTVTSAGVCFAEKTVAITLDDLPFTGKPSDAKTVEAAGNAIVDALVRHEVRASGFVTGINALVEDQIDMRVGLLERWAGAGLFLENHGFSHLSYVKTSRQHYFDDLILGQAIPAHALRARKQPVRFFRAPFNHTGDSDESKRALLDFLGQRDLRLAPFTIEHSDYLFNSLYVAAQAEVGDGQTPSAAQRIGNAYLEALDTAFAFGEEISRDTFGREIPQIFLIHTNLINAHYLDRMLQALRDRGYRFVSLAQAMEDPAYSTTETYAGPHGISWFHRWRSSLGMKNRLRDEPDPQPWVMEAYREQTRTGP